MFDGFFRILWNTITQEVELPQPVVSVLVALSGGLLIPLHRFGDSSLLLKQLAQRILGEVISDLGGAAEPQLCFIIVWQNAQAVPPAFAQLMSRNTEAGVPELFQCLDGLLLLRPGGVVVAENIPGLPICVHHLPVSLETQHLHLFILHVIHLLILKRDLAQLDPLRLPDNHILDCLELLLL